MALKSLLSGNQIRWSAADATVRQKMLASAKEELQKSGFQVHEGPKLEFDGRPWIPPIVAEAEERVVVVGVDDGFLHTASFGFMYAARRAAEQQYGKPAHAVYLSTDRKPLPIYFGMCSHFGVTLVPGVKEKEAGDSLIWCLRGLMAQQMPAADQQREQTQEDSINAPRRPPPPDGLMLELSEMGVPDDGRIP